MKLKHALLFSLPGIVMGGVMPFILTYFTASIPEAILQYAVYVAINSVISTFLAVLITFLVNKKKMAALFVAEYQEKEKVKEV